MEGCWAMICGRWSSAPTDAAISMGACFLGASTVGIFVPWERIFQGLRGVCGGGWLGGGKDKRETQKKKNPTRRDRTKIPLWGGELRAKASDEAATATGRGMEEGRGCGDGDG